MPHTVNGIGTWYYGKDNISGRNTACEFCGSHGYCLSYDTTLYFVLVFIPVFPLKKLRIFDDCPSCKRHRSMPLKDWRKYQEEVAEEIFNDLKNNPSDEEKAKDAIGAAVHHSFKYFLEVSEIILQKFPRSPQVLGMLGHAFLSFNELEKAEQIFRKALALGNDDDIKELLAEVLIKQGRVDEAYEYMKFIVDEGKTDRVGSLIFLGRAYQAHGDHQKALEVFESCSATDPALWNDKHFAKLKKLSVKNIQTGKKINNNIIPSSKEKQKHTNNKPNAYNEGKDLGGKLAKWAGPVLAGIALLVYLLACFYTGRNQEVFLVNGLNKSYAVTLNGKTYKLPKFCKMPLNIPQGKVSLESSDLKIKPEKLKISTNFFIRPFSSNAFVLNPDKTAVMLWSKVYYTTSNVKSIPPEDKIFTGKILYEFPDMDYVFEKFPETISMSEDVTSKNGLELISKGLFDVNAAGYWDFIQKQIGKKRMIVLTKQMLYHLPDSILPLNYLNINLKPEEFVKALKPMLDSKPVPVELHRYYQDAMRTLGRQKELQKEYAAKYKVKNSDSIYKYLYYRVLDDKKKQDSILLEGIKQTPPSPYCFHGLAYNALVAADFSAACKYWKKAIEIDPGNMLFTSMYEKALLADKQYDELLKIQRAKLAKNKFDYNAIFQEMVALILQGKASKADKQIKTRLANMKTGMDKEMLKSVRESEKLYHVLWLYCSGKLSEYIKVVRKMKGAEMPFTLAITEKNLSRAEKAFKAIEQPTLKETLIMFILAKTQNKPKLAQKYRDMVVKQLQKSKLQAAAPITAAFAGKKDPEWSDFLSNGIDYDSRTELLVAVGLINPAIRKKCFDTAAKFNYSPVFPHYFIKDVINQANP